MADERHRCHRPRQITGASAIEFALIFPMLFAIIYGTVTYGYVYYLQQRINFIAQEAVRAAISVAPVANQGAYISAINTAVNTSVNNNFTLGGGVRPAALVVSAPLITVDGVTQTVSILVTYSLTSPTLFPQMVLPMGIGSIPPLPAALQATAAGRLS